VLVRAIFETTCLLFDASRLAEKAVTSDNTKMIDDVDSFLMDVLAGFKSKEWAPSEEFKARNVLTIIQRLSKELDIDLMFFYEGLSEFAHPNYLGMLQAFQTPPSPGEFVVKFHSPTGLRLVRDMEMAIGALAGATELMQSALEKFDEISTRFAVLCERHIYEHGTWPDKLDYPVKRTTK
jgi:hypothetical protein